MSARRSGPTEPPVLTVFAGPNGSGKSTLTGKLASQSRIGILVNADEIAARMASDAGLMSASADMQFQAAVAAEEMRWSLLAQGVSFTTETVMSDEARWLRFFVEARSRGFYMNLFFVTTSDPAINVHRVSERVLHGGHSVDAEKIVSRYRKTHAFLPHALALFDQAWLFDNSLNAELILTKTRDEGLVALVPQEQMPAWATSLAATALPGRS